MRHYFFNSDLPEGLEGLADLAADLRWTWSHASDRLWERLDPEAWERTANPYFILQNAPQSRLQEAARDAELREDLGNWVAERRAYLDSPGWFGRTHAGSALKRVAYFSMEFGLSEALPIYSGGLGILAGDHLKTASDMGVPLVGLGLLYQQGYFRQILGPDAWQLEAFPYNDPVSLPVTPVQNRDGAWLRIRLELPGRTLLLRVWEARVGRVTLYLLDSNDPLNSARDRGVTAHLYQSGQEPRLIQELVLGIGGWRVLEELGLDVEVCHLNEGHAAFAVLARAHGFMRRTGRPFEQALWATRAGNAFTTHTPVEAAFDRFDPALIRPYAERLEVLRGLPVDALLALGRRDPRDTGEPFNMAFLAMRGSAFVNGVSRLHGRVSRGIFHALYPDWPQAEVPVGHVTNGVHVPSWDSPESDALWTHQCGKGRWLETADELCPLFTRAGDAALWDCRAAQRASLVEYVRRRLARQLGEHGAPDETIHRARHVLDPNALTLGFARRFTEYKRPTLLLHDRARLARLLADTGRRVQLIVAGKAHPNDERGKALVQELARFGEQPGLAERFVFLEDYDMALAKELVAGVDVWINTPRRTQEASGTSGMKVLVNGGLNLSELDGWWDEAYSSEVGWSIGDEGDPGAPGRDAAEAAQLYDILERQVVPEFYDRDPDGIPQAWIARVRASMSRLTPRFSSNRMLREYVDRVYLPAAAAYDRRTADGARLAGELRDWQARLAEDWAGLRFGEARVKRDDDAWRFDLQVYCGGLDPAQLRVELYADAIDGQEPCVRVLERAGPIPGAVNGHRYTGTAPAGRPAGHYTPRIVPFHPDAFVPLEEAHIVWRR